MTTTKKDLALEVAKDTACKKSLAAKMVESIFKAMRESLINGDRIEIRGFGVFQVKNTKPKPAETPGIKPEECYERYALIAYYRFIQLKGKRTS